MPIYILVKHHPNTVPDSDKTHTLFLSKLCFWRTGETILILVKNLPNSCKAIPGSDENHTLIPGETLVVESRFPNSGKKITQ
jgi:hypothetical protein